MQEPFLTSTPNKQSKQKLKRGPSLDQINIEDMQLEQLDKNAKKTKYHKNSRTIYAFGKHPARYMMGTLYALQCLYIGMSTNPLTPLSITVTKVSFNLEKKQVF